ncbi:hypothetical protein LOAG_13726 [Loa loa]|uniref:Uncharacterized protein n=1 Tax=Loa loa TaxID=7209 RepID=A0A1I7VLL3_LOALO|nr:hypothetical protein LOAG_13726 [Loa loa]EFO14788.1 hypothetical protein LOAG_13726 [Loa loa]
MDKWTDEQTSGRQTNKEVNGAMEKVNTEADCFGQVIEGQRKLWKKQMSI